MPSADSCRHIPAPHDASSTTAHRQASPGNAHSPSRLCPPHIRPCFPCKNRTSEIFASSSSMTASNAIPVRQASALPSASFRFHLTMNTLAVQLAVPLAGPAEDFHLQVSAPCRAHKTVPPETSSGGFVVEASRLELLTPCLQSRCSPN